jgi:GT2 family glycosyltransferase/glycosyltransferase involved in cell wall biosynthesis
MNRFWNVLIRPIIEDIQAKYIIEIGSHTGLNTKNILEYCTDNDAHMTAIDPFPKFDIDEFKSKYGNKFEIYKDTSLNILPGLKNYDVVLIDGDHNWYTVYNELKTIETSFKNQDFPIIFLHDIAWPYARRDLYYNPEDIPPEYRQPYKKLGMYPGQSSLLDEGGLNPENYNNAIYENNPNNGILTAVEDFIDESDMELNFKFIPIYHGLGILYPKNDEIEVLIEKIINNIDFLTGLEDERLKLTIERNELKVQKNILQKDLKNNRLKNVKLEDQLENQDLKLNQTKYLLKEKERQINEIETQLKQAKEEIKSSKDLIKTSNELIISMKGNEKKIEELNKHVNLLLNNVYEMGYYNNQGRSIKQRLTSIFSSLYILTHQNNGFKNIIKNIRGYNTIKRDHLLDIGYYLNNNPDVRFSGKDPILHYMYQGYKEGRNPSSKFNGNYYLEKYPDVKFSNLNPLVHYSLYGIKEGRKTVETRLTILNKLEFKQFSRENIDDIIDALDNKKVSIIVPIYNAFEDTKNCVESVLENTKIPYELILIDDCSPDERIGIFLDEMEKIPNIKVIRNKENKGFVKNINIGMQNSDGDVVLLNSDTMVTPKWLQKLVIAAYSDRDIGTVTPLSNAAGAFSVPEIGKNNDIPKSMTLEEMASLVEKSSKNVYLEVPTGNGFCMLIKRETIDDVGFFDEENFGKGYGEENDFCMRASQKSWKNILDDTTYIYHKRSASFSTEKEELMKKNRKILDKLYPSYTPKIKEFIADKNYEEIRNRIKDSLTESELKENRILYVLHSAGGGTPATNEDLMRNIQDEIDCFVLTSSSKVMMLWSYNNKKLELIYDWKIESKWSAKDFHNPEFRDIYFNVLNVLKIDIIHIRHLINHTFDLPDVTNSLCLPSIISFHDFYFVCPSHNLLDDNNVYCGGNCTEGNGQCLIGDDLDDLPILKDFVHEWRREVSDIFLKTSAFVTTTEVVKELYISIYPELSQKKFLIIEHGRDFKKLAEPKKTYKIPSKNKPIKILFPGNISVVKGSELIKDIKKLDQDNRLEFHFIGSLALHSSDIEKYGKNYGSYQREDFCKIVAEIKPSFIGILTIGPETYCHTLSEAWSCGVPVLTTKIGALEERVNINGGGWFLNHENPQEAYNEIIRIANSPEEYIEVTEQVQKIKFKSTKEMAEDYIELYYKLLGDKYRIPAHRDLKKSLKGKNGFLFLLNDSNNEIRQHFDESYENNFDSSRFIEKIEYKMKYCENIGIKYYFFLIPDKSLVCKDLLPFKTKLIKRNYDAINRLVPDFIENLDQSCYFKIDTHMNYIGGRELSYSYLHYIDNNFKKHDYDSLLDEQVEIEKTNLKNERLIGDLLSMQNWSYSDEEKQEYIEEETVLLINKYLEDLKEKIPDEFKICKTRETEYYYNPKSFTNLKVLILRDSSLKFLKDPLSIYFKEILLYWDHWDFNQKLVEWYKPDLILEIRTERFLENMG